MHHHQPLGLGLPFFFLRHAPAPSFCIPSSASAYQKLCSRALVLNLRSRSRFVLPLRAELVILWNIDGLEGRSVVRAQGYVVRRTRFHLSKFLK
jgi:hypothetical protein